MRSAFSPASTLPLSPASSCAMPSSGSSPPGSGTRQTRRVAVVLGSGYDAPRNAHLLDGLPDASTGARGWATTLTLAAVVMTLSGLPRPWQFRWCLLPVLRRSTGDDRCPPPFPHGCGSRPHTPWTRRVCRPRSARVAGRGAADRRLLPAATTPCGASSSARSRTLRHRAGLSPAATRRPIGPDRQQRLDQRPHTPDRSRPTRATQQDRVTSSTGVLADPWTKETPSSSRHRVCGCLTEFEQGDGLAR